MSAREDILQRIRTATADVTEPDPALDVPVEWTYGQPLATADVLACRDVYFAIKGAQQ